MDLRKKMLARAPSGGRWYEIRNANDPSVATIRIYQEIGYWGVTAEDFARELANVTAPSIELQINSPGGDVFDGIAIYNALRMHPARVTTRVDGIAASAASVVAQAGDRRVMVSGGQIMIHEAWGVAIGPASDMREFADLLDKQSDVIATIYAERSGRDQAELRAMMAAETWLTDTEAVEAGLADEVFVPARQDDKPNDRGADDLRAAVAAELERLGINDLSRLGGEQPDTDEPAGVDQDAARSLLAAFSLGGNPHE